MARVEVQAEGAAVLDGFKGAYGRPVVVGDFAGADFMGEAHAKVVEHVQDRVPALSEVGVPVVDHARRHGWEHRDCVPDRRAGETDDCADSKLCCGPGGRLDFFACAAAYAFGIDVAQDAGRKDATVPTAV